MENEEIKKTCEQCLEDDLAHFSCRFNEVYNSMCVLRNALTNDVDELENRQIEDLVDILLERMEENKSSLQSIIDKVQKASLAQEA